MSYFKHLKLTKKGEQLQAKINGNLSETLTFTKAELGGGNITNEEEIRFLTTLKEKWGDAVIAKCELQGEEKTMVSLELQFTNAELQENKIFRELALYARGNDGQEILYAYANAGENYDYIPLMKDSPHSFIITIYFAITSGTKIDANIDLSGHVSLKTFKEKIKELEENINSKEEKIEKNDGFNLTKTSSYKENDSNKVATAQGLYNLWQNSEEKYEECEKSFEKNDAFNKKFGIIEGTVLEGKRLAELMGVVKYGGLITQKGRKYQDWAYYDPSTREMFYCKSNNSEVTTSQTYFTPFSNKAILNRLENLYSFSSEIIYNNFSSGKQTISIKTKKYKFLIVIGKETNWGYYSTGIIPVLNTIPYNLAVGASISGEKNDHFVVRLEADKISITDTRSYHKQIFAIVGYY